MTSPRNAFPIGDASDFKAWKHQNANAEKLLFRIIFRWRVSSARLRGQPGKWVANPIDFWASEAKLSRHQTKRALATLELDRLITRRRGWFAGSKVHPFLQPTPLALKHMGRPGDMNRLEASLAPEAAPPSAPQGAPSDIPTAAPIAAPTITSLSIPSKPPSPSKPSNAHAKEEGKEGSGGKEKKTKLKIKKKSGPEAPTAPPTSHQLDAETAEAIMKAKEAKAKKLLPTLLKKFPILEGPHRTGKKPVRHPYELHDWKWATWSIAKIEERYAVYKGYVANWYVGKQGQTYKPFSEEDADFELEIDWEGTPDYDEWWEGKEAAAKSKKSTAK